jgi:FkbM family methyltransferase
MQLKTVLKECKRWAKCSSPREREEFWRVFAFERMMKLPVVFTDKGGLKFVLYPGQNAEVYFKNEGNYEVAEMRFVEGAVRSGMTAIDVGANIGMYALPLARLVGPSGHVHAFEPEDKNHERLTINLALNGFGNVTLNKSAVFSETKTLKLNLFPDEISSWHSLGMPEMPDPFNPGKTVKPTRVQEVPGVSLDDYCTKRGIGQVDFLKVDVEGAELEVLQGCRRLLSEGAVRHIMFEVSLPQIQGMGHHKTEIFTLLESAGYTSRPIQPDGSLGDPVKAAGLAYGNYIATKVS